MDIDLTERAIAVTCGTKGTGRAVVENLTPSGAKVFFHGRDESSAAEVVSACAGASLEPVFVRGDLQEYQDVEHLLDTAIEQRGSVTGLVASGSARMPRPKPVLETDPELLGDYFNGRSLPRIRAARSAAERMEDQSYGKIVMLTSGAGRVSTLSEALVGAACASVMFFARAAAREMVRNGIRINAIAVSVTEGAPSHRAFEAAAAEQSDEMIVMAFAKLACRAPFGLSTSEEIADLVAYFLGAETDGITGATLSVNRGTYFPAY
jgi:2-hydroxycyclohexanecarboxyl-CoA dehydrogenase